MAARRDRLARARKAAGYTQERLAEELHIDRTAVHTWESGKHEPLPYLRPKLARLLGLTLRELETLLANETPAEPKSTSTDEHWAALFRHWVDTMNRRELLQLLGWTAATASAPSLTNLNTDEQERVAKAITTPQRVDNQVIEHIETIYWTCRRQDDALGPQAVLPTVLAQLSAAQGMLRDCPGELRPKLLSTCGGLSGLAGWLFSEAADYGNAWQFYDRGRELSHEARDSTMSSFTLGRMSHTALMQDKAHLAIDYAEASRRAAERSDDTLVRAHAASQAARAYARDGQSDECLTALEQAEARLAQAGKRDASLAYFYDSGSLANAKAICHLNLRQPTEAVSQARNALRLHNRSLVRDNAYTMLYLAQAHVQLQEPDAAVLIMEDVIEATTRNRSVRLRERLRDTRRALEPWRDSNAVKTLDERLTDNRA
ncbi:helix-turn-helix transcriptional regulator [Actinokineospora iranica]|uniref:DNA-binding transcriptional regulator, XRE-family HTH domain n=1 Tax=Actinokineospora iranica TaxID=1271860 RepID=A0A1G6SWL7_9PSEU|nr:helix-turn-helix domain-containing protein [Actinokineospora iranica]SDD21208.1 DNA-binding transcriptional regulator, XRE-family HTH domain [Actinokineospora iranica]